MPLRDSPDRFGTVSKLLHWVTALAVAGTVPLAWVMQDMPLGLAKFEAYGWHKSVGMAVLALTVARLAWRRFNPRPVPRGRPGWRRQMAPAVQGGFYACLLALPALGWLHSAAANTPVSVFGLFVLPAPIAPDRRLVEPLAAAHGTLAWLLLALVGLHVLGALLHHVRDRDDTLRRMLPLLVAAMIGSAAVAGPARADDAAWRLDPAASAITIGATQMGAAFEGVFRRFEAEILFDPAAPADARVRVVVDTASLDTGNAQRDATARGPDWFDVAAHPVARFVADGFRAIGPGRYAAAGVLTIKGVARPVTLPFTLTVDGDRARATGAVTIARADFALGTGDWAGDGVVGDIVEVRIAVAAEADRR